MTAELPDPPLVSTPFQEGCCSRCGAWFAASPDDLCPQCGDRADELLEAKERADSKINHPAHYNAGKIEVIDAIEDWKLGFHLGNVVKYVARAAHKGATVEDLRKAKWYLDRAIKNAGGT